MIYVKRLETLQFINREAYLLAILTKSIYQSLRIEYTFIVVSSSPYLAILHQLEGDVGIKYSYSTSVSRKGFSVNYLHWSVPLWKKLCNFEMNESLYWKKESHRSQVV